MTTKSERVAQAAPAQTQEPLPSAGGSYERAEGGELQRMQATEPAPDRAKPEPDGQGTARPVEGATGSEQPATERKE